MNRVTRWPLADLGTRKLVGGLAVLAMLLRFPA